ncbi:chromosome partitioning protein ParB [Rhizobium leguminosarum bv. trifolii]|uniref:Chromosome partitioning protein ParB n=1 Tax=Rhizobium leguminosarum bv. trifolii TaxID=386 RepID=A0A3E1BHE0_RHILT|nr:ParB N-terminal domain-containing protein [Rhizobium leguminosarum]RFB91795.1 chromosome partitioning protein ParB [Rhizobium leguminosarum bv. trifolii]RFB92312.1 chromosome partitioning protein ParB [Rhizobium leguminosarum bv. trifolii]
MAEFKRILISEIVIPERLRAVEEEHALAIAQSIVEHGLINPITVRATPNAKGGKYTLVAGAHRIRAVQINDDVEVEAMIVEGDKAEAQLIEITENLFRNDLSVMDRAVFVQTYREVWETKFGKVEAGRPGNRANLAQLLADEAEAGSFSKHVADRMGISRRAVEYLNKIAQNLHPDVRAAIRGTPVADNQSALLKIAKMEPLKQRQAALAFRAEPDVKKALALVDPAPALSKTQAEQGTLLSRLVTAWEDASEETRNQFLEHIGLGETTDPLMAEIRSEADSD